MDQQQRGKPNIPALQMTQAFKSIHEAPALTTELAFLLRCGRPTLRAVDADAARELLLQPPAWPRLEAMAAYHGLEPLLHRQVAQYAHLAAAVPAETRARWQQAARLNAAHALMLTDELRAVLHILADHDIPAMPYKGVALGEQLYGDAGLRVNGDIDIIVPTARREEAVQALRTERSYTPLYAFHSPRQEAQYIRNIHHYNLMHPTRSIMVEVHWDATGRADAFAPDWPGIWTRSTAGVWQGAPAQMPAPEDLFLLLALHGSKHQWSLLKWLVDVGALVEATPAMDWTLAAARAGQWRIRRSFELTCALLRELLDIATTAPATSPLLPQVVAQIEAMAEPAVAAKIPYMMQLHDRRAQGLRYATNLLFSLNFQDLHAEQTSAAEAYIRRPWRILRKRGVAFLGQLGQAITRGAFNR